MGLPKTALLAVAGAAAVAVGGCSGGDSGAETGPRAPIATTPPPPPETGNSLSPDSATPGAPSTTGNGTCGTVHAASGLNLQVVDVAASGIDCAEAERLVREFVARIADLHPAGSDDSVSVSVHGWQCVSGPQTGGATTCSNQDRTVHARVVPQ